MVNRSGMDVYRGGLANRDEPRPSRRARLFDWKERPARKDRKATAPERKDLGGDPYVRVRIPAAFAFQRAAARGSANCDQRRDSRAPKQSRSPSSQVIRGLGE